MDVEVSGTSKAMTRDEVRYVTRLFGHVILGSRLAKHVYVEVVYEPMKIDYCGFCTPTDHGYRNHRYFEITLNSRMSRAMQIRTLAHEMVHVMQFARNELRILDSDDSYKWRGRLMRVKREKYFSMPWEREAHNSEEYLIEFYRQHCKRYAIKFRKRRRKKK